MDYIKEFNRWCEKAVADEDIIKELQEIKNDNAKIEDAFYRNLAFGTGGMRGVLGAGTNRMNFYTVSKLSQGLAQYVLNKFPKEKQKIAVSYDSRIKSDLFSKVASGVFAANGIKVEIYKELMPTPCLSYAVRTLNCAAGIMVTASHNPAKYNGYKVYGPDGCQITNEAADAITDEIEKLDIFNDVKNMYFEEGIRQGLISYISDDVYTSFTEAVKKTSVLFGDSIDKNVSIVYSALNGTGLKPVTRCLEESGYTNITVVKEQEKPDGNFPTCPYPNPEIREAMELGIQYAQKVNAELLLATDPDCDRVGIAVRNEKNEMVLLSGNETGMLLLDYICSQRIKYNKMPKDPVLVKTIVSTDMADSIAAKYGVKTINVLTGFKFIGEQIGLLEKKGHADSYIFGFEESYGYLSGTHARDKDAVNASFLICEMAAYYKTNGISILERLNQIYKEYGYCINSLKSYTFEGSAGFKKMQDIMKKLQSGVTAIGPKKVEKELDYSKGIDGLPKSDVLKYKLEGNSSVVVRPSGTEPKLKIYISVLAADKNAAVQAGNLLIEDMEKYLK